MTFIKLATATLTTSLFVTTAMAQPVPFSEIDTDTDGVLSYEELVTTFGEDGAATVLETADSDADDSLTKDELRAGGDARREERAANRAENEASDADGDAEVSEDATVDGTSDDDRTSEDRPRQSRHHGHGHGPAHDGENANDTDEASE